MMLPFFEQTKGVAIGSPVIPIVANIYMEAIENRAISTALLPPWIWKRYVDDTLVIQHQSHKEDFLRHINLVDPSIQFHYGGIQGRWSHPLYRYHHTTSTRWNPHNRVYRKPTHTDLYIPCDSYHNLSAKYSVINTLSHIGHTIYSLHNYWRMNYNIWRKYICCANIPSGPLTRYSTNNKRRKRERRRNRPLYPNTLLESVTWWCLMYKASVRVSEHKWQTWFNTLREDKYSRTF